jgi:hypothetical protein
MSSIKNDFYDIRLPHLSTKELRCQHLDSELIVNGIAAVECGIHTVVDQDSYKRQRKAVDVASAIFVESFVIKSFRTTEKRFRDPINTGLICGSISTNTSGTITKRSTRSLVLAASTCENTRVSYHPTPLADATFWIGYGFTHTNAGAVIFPKRYRISCRDFTG